MSAEVIHPRAFNRAPAQADDQSELLAAAHLLRVAAERPEKRAEIAEAVADYLATLRMVIR